MPSITLPNGPMPTIPPGGIAPAPLPMPPVTGGNLPATPVNPYTNQQQTLMNMLGGLNLPGINGQQYVAQAQGTNTQSPAIPTAGWSPSPLPNSGYTPVAPIATNGYNPIPLNSTPGSQWQNMAPVATGTSNTLAPVGTGTSAQVSSIGGGSGGMVEDPALSGQRIQGFLDNLLNSGNPYLVNAARRGQEQAGQRGALNSSISAGASTRSAIEASMPILNQIAGLNSSREGMRFQGGESAADRNLRAGLQAQSLNFEGGQNDQNRGLQAAMQAAGFNFEGGQNDQNRSLQAAMQAAGFNFEGGQGDLNRGLQERIQNNQLNFQGQQSAEDRTLQAAMQNAGFNFQGSQADLERNMSATLQQQGWGFQAAQAEAGRQVQVLLDREGRAFSGEQSALDRTQGVNNALLGQAINMQDKAAGNYYDQSNALFGSQLQRNTAAQDFEFRRSLQSDSVAQQDWLANNSFSREFNAGLSMIPIQNASQLQNYMMQAAINQPEVFTPEVMSGMQNFFNNNFLAMMQSYFPGGTS